MVSAIAYEPTVPLPLPVYEPTPEDLRDEALSVIAQLHPRVANTIRSLWPDRECGDYINKLLMDGDDGAGHARLGFHQEAVDAMMRLVDLHEKQFNNF
jgi:hypothetical protein